MDDNNDKKLKMEDHEMSETSSFHDEEEGGGGGDPFVIAQVPAATTKEDQGTSTDKEKEGHSTPLQERKRCMLVLGVFIIVVIVIVLIAIRDKGSSSSSSSGNASWFTNPQAVQWQARGPAISIPRPDDGFKLSIDLSASGTTLLVGVSKNSQDYLQVITGFAKVYQLDEEDGTDNPKADQWIEEFHFAEPDVHSFALSMALSGNGQRIVLGSGFGSEGFNPPNFNRTMYVYDRVPVSSEGTTTSTPYTWVQQTETIMSETHDELPVTLDLDYNGTVLAVGFPYHDNVKPFTGQQPEDTTLWTGRIELYQASKSVVVAGGGDDPSDVGQSTTWQLASALEGTKYHDLLGSLLALSSNGQVLVDSTFRANTDNGLATGQVLSWTKQQQSATAATTGNDDWLPLPPLLGTTALQGFGTRLALNGHGTVLAVTSPGTAASPVMVYERSSPSSDAAWTLHSTLPAGGAIVRSLCLNHQGNVLVVGRKGGVVQAYQWNAKSLSWQAVGFQLTSSSLDNDDFGKEVACSADGRTFAVVASRATLQVFGAKEG